MFLQSKSSFSEIILVYNDMQKKIKYKQRKEAVDEGEGEGVGWCSTLIA